MIFKKLVMLCPKKNIETDYILKRKSRRDMFFTSGWQRKVSVQDLMDAGIVTEETALKMEEGSLVTLCLQ